jgi:hypothetical protein
LRKAKNISRFLSCITGAGVALAAGGAAGAAVVDAGGVMPSASLRKTKNAAMKPRSKEANRTTIEALSVGAPWFAHSVMVGVHVESRIAKNIKIACCMSVKPSLIDMLLRKRRGVYGFIFCAFKGQRLERHSEGLPVQGDKVRCRSRRAVGSILP